MVFRESVIAESLLKHDNLLVTDFKQLIKLKARSRAPININDDVSKETINFSSFSDDNKQHIVDVNKSSFQANVNFKKSFSFVSKIYEKRFMQIECQQERLTISTTTSSSDLENSFLHEKSPSGSSSSSCNDSGYCRSSVISVNTQVSEKDEYSDDNDNQTQKLSNEQLITYEDVNKMKKICHQLYARFKSLKNVSKSELNATRSTNNDGKVNNNVKRKEKKTRTKVLTVLFDYEDDKNCMYQVPGVKFSVKQGEAVYLINEINEKYYLVSKVRDGKLGYIPKDYTIDLKEIKRKLKNNIKQQATVKLTQL